MKVLQTRWKQENDNVIEQALIFPKIITLTREDVETIQPQEDGTEFIEWKSRGQWTCILEVYPDLEAFNKRVYPIAIFKKVIFLPYDEITLNDFSEYFLKSLLEEQQEVGQDFSEGKIIDVTLKVYTPGSL